MKLIQLLAMSALAVTLTTVTVFAKSETKENKQYTTELKNAANKISSKLQDNYNKITNDEKKVKSLIDEINTLKNNNVDYCRTDGKGTLLSKGGGSITNHADKDTPAVTYIDYVQKNNAVTPACKSDDLYLSVVISCKDVLTIGKNKFQSNVNACNNADKTRDAFPTDPTNAH